MVISNLLHTNFFKLKCSQYKSWELFIYEKSFMKSDEGGNMKLIDYIMYCHIHVEIEVSISLVNLKRHVKTFSKGTHWFPRVDS
jgi:hypothetical protein